LVGALRQEFLVLFQRVVDGIKQVLKVIETDQADLISLLLLGGNVFDSETEDQDDEYET
jgi:hypothetical protein